MSSNKVPQELKKSNRQLRGEALAREMREQSPKPMVIEFAGLPKAGKSSTLSNVQMFLKRCGFKTEVVVERASVCPIKDKKHAHFNAWTACTTLAQILEKTQEPPRADDAQILFLDRGLFDAICWFRVMERLCRIRKEDREQIERFLRIDDWRDKVSSVILMTANPEDALEREKGLLEIVGSPGSIMNPEVLNQLRIIYDHTAEELKDEFSIIRIDTSDSDLSTPNKSAEYALDKVLDLIEVALEEKILYLPVTDIERLFGSSKAVGRNGASQLVSKFESKGDYSPRREVEVNASVVQALPIVVVRNNSGDVLVLLRKEANPRNALHQKTVIWAGGHVRREDGPENVLVNCAIRELHEELRISIEENTLSLLGAVYDKSSDRSAKHVALVYEWRAPSNDVAIALSADEFFERHGTSLTGQFVTVESLASRVANGELTESWSLSVADFLFSIENIKAGDNLF